MTTEKIIDLLWKEAEKYGKMGDETVCIYVELDDISEKDLENLPDWIGFGIGEIETTETEELLKDVYCIGCEAECLYQKTNL